MSLLFDQIQQLQKLIHGKWAGQPKLGLVLGTGLGALAQEIKTECTIPYSELPHFPQSTVKGHAGRLVCGQLAGVSVMAMDGRFHAYEGYSLQEITFPIRVMKAMGCSYLIVSNAAGGLNPQFAKGDLMVIEDHINLLGDNPLIGPNDERLGVRFPDMSEPYAKNLIELTQKVAIELKTPLQKGVYAVISGPCLETRAEYRFLRQIGADVIGMSTVPEVIVGVHAGMKCLGFSVVTDMCLPDALHPVTHDEILAVANQAESKLRGIVRTVIERLP